MGVDSEEPAVLIDGDGDVDEVADGEEYEEIDPENDVTVTFIICPISCLTALWQQSVPLLAHQNPRPWRGQGITYSVSS